MFANIMSAWLCAAGVEVAAALGGVVGAGDCATSLAELLHAPMTATVASAVTALAKVLGLFTSISLSSG
jgi:chemotaxis protein CheY-P-specific phosphatase CheC